MRSPAQFMRPFTDGHNADAVTVLFTKKCHRTVRPSFVLGHYLRVNIQVS